MWDRRQETGECVCVIVCCKRKTMRRRIHGKYLWGKMQHIMITLLMRVMGCNSTQMWETQRACKYRLELELKHTHQHNGVHSVSAETDAAVRRWNAAALLKLYRDRALESSFIAKNVHPCSSFIVFCVVFWNYFPRQCNTSLNFSSLLQIHVWYHLIL